MAWEIRLFDAVDRLGPSSACLLGEDPVEVREEAMRRLQSGKEFLVALDFVDNFRQSYVARLALMG